MSLPATAPFWCSKRWEFEPNQQCLVVNSRPTAAPMWCKKGGRCNLAPVPSRWTRSAGRGSRELADSHSQADTMQPPIVAPFRRRKDMARRNRFSRRDQLLPSWAMLPPRDEWAQMRARSRARCVAPHATACCAIVIAVLLQCL